MRARIPAVSRGGPSLARFAPPTGARHPARGRLHGDGLLHGLSSTGSVGPGPASHRDMGRSGGGPPHIRSSRTGMSTDAAPLPCGRSTFPEFRPVRRRPRRGAFRPARSAPAEAFTALPMHLRADVGPHSVSRRTRLRRAAPLGLGELAGHRRCLGRQSHRGIRSVLHGPAPGKTVSRGRRTLLPGCARLGCRRALQARPNQPGPARPRRRAAPGWSDASPVAQPNGLCRCLSPPPAPPRTALPPWGSARPGSGPPYRRRPARPALPGRVSLCRPPAGPFSRRVRHSWRPLVPEVPSRPHARRTEEGVALRISGGRCLSGSGFPLEPFPSGAVRSAAAPHGKRPGRWRGRGQPPGLAVYGCPAWAGMRWAIPAGTARFAEPDWPGPAWPWPTAP